MSKFTVHFVQVVSTSITVGSDRRGHRLVLGVRAVQAPGDWELMATTPAEQLAGHADRLAETSAGVARATKQVSAFVDAMRRAFQRPQVGR